MLKPCSIGFERSRGILALAIIVLIAGGCSNPDRKPIHEMAEQPEGVTLSCQRCYDLVARVLTAPPKHRRYKTVERHACSDCASEAVIYDDPDGRPMIRCTQCAPAGVPCDRCLPPTKSDEHDHGSP